MVVVKQLRVPHNIKPYSQDIHICILMHTIHSYSNGVYMFLLIIRHLLIRMHLVLNKENEAMSGYQWFQ